MFCLSALEKNFPWNLIWFLCRTQNAQKADFSPELLFVCLPNAQISVKFAIAQACKRIHPQAQRTGDPLSTDPWKWPSGPPGLTPNLCLH